jgi:predicted small secreted protein
LEFKMKKSILLIILLISFQGCATWYGIKKDSKDAWQATKETTGKAYDSTKEAIHEATE